MHCLARTAPLLCTPRSAAQDRSRAPSPGRWAPGNRICCYSAASDLRYLLEQNASLSKRDVDRIVKLNPELAAVGPTAASAVIARLCELGLDAQDVAKVCLRYPLVLASRKDQMDEVLAFLTEDLGFGQADLRQLIVRFPILFTYGVKAHLRPHLAYLQSLGELDLPDLVKTRPAVLGEGIEAVVRFLQLCRVPRRDVARMLRTYPTEYSLQLRVSSTLLAELTSGVGKQEEDGSDS